MLLGAGVITMQKADDIVKVIQGELASPPETGADQEAARTPREIKSEEELKRVVREWQKERERQEDDLRARKEAIDSMQRELENVRVAIDMRQQEFDKREADFQAARAAELAAAKDEGFRATVTRYEKMEEKDVAESFYGLADDDVLKYLRVFKPSFGAGVLTEIKKIDEESPGWQRDRPNRAARLQEILAGGWTAPAARAAEMAANE